MHCACCATCTRCAALLLYTACTGALHCNALEHACKLGARRFSVTTSQQILCKKRSTVRIKKNPTTYWISVPSDCDPTKADNGVVKRSPCSTKLKVPSTAVPLSPCRSIFSYQSTKKKKFSFALKNRPLVKKKVIKKNETNLASDEILRPCTTHIDGIDVTHPIAFLLIVTVDNKGDFVILVYL